MISFLISLQNHISRPLLNRLLEMVHMRGHNMFYAELTKIVFNYDEIRSDTDSKNLLNFKNV